MMLLSAGDRDRLIACMRLWERPGTAAERDAAAAAAVRILKNRGLSRESGLAPAPFREPPVCMWRATCSELQKRVDELGPFERQFVADLPKFPRLSPKQLTVLQKIAARVLGSPVA